MAKSQAVQSAVVRVHSAYVGQLAALKEVLVARLDARGERGDVAPRTVGIAVMAALAISVGAVITTKVKGKADGIDLSTP